MKMLTMYRERDWGIFGFFMEVVVVNANAHAALATLVRDGGFDPARFGMIAMSYGIGLSSPTPSSPDGARR